MVHRQFIMISAFNTNCQLFFYSQLSCELLASSNVVKTDQYIQLANDWIDTLKWASVLHVIKRHSATRADAFVEDAIIASRHRLEMQQAGSAQSTR